MMIREGEKLPSRLPTFEVQATSIISGVGIAVKVFGAWDLYRCGICHLHMAKVPGMPVLPTAYIGATKSKNILLNK